MPTKNCSMLSILIPIYNKNVVKLVETLVKQCHKSKIAFEILCFDDKSRKNIREKNEAVNFLFGVNYVNLSENMGRAKIRNRLGKMARFDNMIFLDCDSRLPNAKFIKRYLDYIDKEQITCGGTIYSKKEPKSIKRKLHWKYGSTREALPAKKRNRRPFQDFHSNNFMMHKKIFKRISFDESISLYGYEDTLFAEEVTKAGYRIFHIDNPVIHMGIENTEIFLDKTKKAIHNLISLYKVKKIKHTRLIRFYLRLHRLGIDSFVHSFLKKKEENILTNLHSSSPSIFQLNLWKLKLFLDGLNND